MNNEDFENLKRVIDEGFAKVNKKLDEIEARREKEEKENKK
jgi:hypothetical protein